MSEWMGQAFDDSIATPWGTIFIRLTVAFLLSLAVLVIYKFTRRAVNSTVSFPATLVLLCILIAMVTQVIGDNAARAFSLVGALSVVRFRTVVRDTKDTAFVIFAVVVGMATGYGQSGVALIGLCVVGVAAYIFRDHPTGIPQLHREMRLIIKLIWSQELETLVVTRLAKFADDIDAVAAETIKQGSGMALTFRLRLKPAAKLTHVVAEVSRLEGIQSVELGRDREE